MLTIGRSADIIIDDNQFLHRVLANFRHANGLWWIDALRSSIGLALNDEESDRLAKGCCRMTR